MPILAILLIVRVGGKGTKESDMSSKGLNTRDARGWFYNRTAWDHEGDHVGLQSNLGLELN